MFKQSYDLQISSQSNQSPFARASGSFKESKHLEGYLSDESAISNCSTNNSLNSSPVAERHMMDGENQSNFSSRSSQDDSRKSSQDRSDSDLKSLMEAEDELKSIWSKKPIKVPVKALNPSFQFQSQNRIRKSEGSQIENRENKKFEKLVFQPLHKQVSFNNQVPERPSNPQGRDEHFNGNYQFIQNSPVYQEPVQYQYNSQYQPWVQPNWNMYAQQAPAFYQSRQLEISNFQQCQYAENAYYNEY